MGAFKVLLLQKTLSWEQINSSSFGLVWKFSSWKQLSHQLKCCWLQWPHWGRNKHVIFDVWLGDVLPLGFQREVPFLPPHILPPLPGMLPRWQCTSFHLFQHSWRGICSRKGKDKAPLGGSYILVFHHSSYVPVSPLKCESSLLVPKPPPQASWTPAPDLNSGKGSMRSMSTYSADICIQDGQNSSPSIIHHGFASVKCLMAGYYKHTDLCLSFAYLSSKHQCCLLCFAKSGP